MGLFLQDHRPSKTYVTRFGTFSVGTILGLVTVVVVQNIVGAWPTTAVPSLDVEVSQIVDAESALDANRVAEFAERVATAAADTLRQRSEATDPVTHYALVRVGQSTGVTWDARLLLISVWFGALGSLVHAGSSFVRFAGNRQLVASWVPWYFARPLLGAGLATLFYVVVRAGLATTGGIPLEQFSHFTVAAFAGMVGLFTQQATKKLADVFKALFTPRPEDEDADRLASDGAEDTPRIQSVSPTWLQVGTTPVPVVLEGENIGDDLTLLVDGVETKFDRLSDGSVRFTIDATTRSKPGSLEVKLKSAAGTSDPKRILITS